MAWTNAYQDCFQTVYWRLCHIQRFLLGIWNGANIEHRQWQTGHGHDDDDDEDDTIDGVIGDGSVLSLTLLSATMPDWMVGS
jgi:hypothetical protein